MDALSLRKTAPAVYGIIVAIAWITASRSIAVGITVVGALLLGLMYMSAGPTIARSGEGRNRDRRRRR